MVLHPGGCGRVGHRRTTIRSRPQPVTGWGLPHLNTQTARLGWPPLPAQPHPARGSTAVEPHPRSFNGPQLTNARSLVGAPFPTRAHSWLHRRRSEEPGLTRFRPEGNPPAPNLASTAVEPHDAKANRAGVARKAACTERALKGTRHLVSGRLEEPAVDGSGV
jgi:hypothetical protein